MTTVAPYTGPAGEFPSHSIFDAAVDADAAALVVITDDDGVHFGWQFTEEAAGQYHINNPDRIAYGGLRTPSTAKQATMDASVAAAAAAATKLTNARNVVKAQVARVKLIQPASSRSDQDKWLMSLSLLMLAEE